MRSISLLYIYIYIYIYIYWLFAPSPNHHMCLFLSRACFIQDVSKFSAPRQLEKRTEEITEKTQNVVKKHRRAPQNTQTWAFGKVLGESFRLVGFRSHFGSLLDLFLVPFGELWRPFRLLWGPKTWQGIGINLRLFVEHGLFEFLVDFRVPWDRFLGAFWTVIRAWLRKWK